MNKLEAISAMMQGKKMTHCYFSYDEWVTIRGGHFVFEDGVQCSPALFWHDRTIPGWLNGWSE